MIYRLSGMPLEKKGFNAGSVTRTMIFAMVWVCLVAFIPQPDKSVSVSEGSSIIKILSDIVIKNGIEVNKAISIGGDVRVYGHVRKDAVSVGGSVYLGPDSIVEGNVVSIGGTVEREPGAQVGGEVTIVDATGLKSYLFWLPKQGIARINEFWDSIGWIPALGFFIIALFIVAIMPAAVGFISFQIENNTLRTILWGLFGSILVFPIGFMLIISIVGIVIVPVLIILLGCAFTLGYIAVAQLMGKRITITLRKPNRHILVETIIGLVVLFIVSRIPFAGWLVKYAAVLVGFGGVLNAITTGWRTRQ
ncbi:MAG: hypothetical protein ACLQDF_07605 [Desulfomonilia bacterium]